VALIGFAFYPIFATDSVNRSVEAAPVTDPVELAARRRDVVGTYSTGSQPGDRVIVVLGSGTARFYEIGARGAINDTTENYRIARHDGQLCLATSAGGAVDVKDADTLVYWRDLYQRSP